MYEIRTASAPPSAPYEALSDAMQTAEEYSLVWERGYTFHIYEIPAERLVGSFSGGVIAREDERGMRE